MTHKKDIAAAQAAHLSIEIAIAAPVGRVWDIMIGDIRAWWRADFLACEGSLGMRLEPRVGGLLVEETPGDACGLAWGQIISFQPPRRLSYLAQIAPPWGGPAQSVVQIALAPEGDGDGTRLTLTDSLIGRLDDALLSCVEDGWGQLFGEGGLKGFVESR